jgi:hypothetical protein
MAYEYKKICDNLLKGFSPRTKECVERRFGLSGGEGETLEAIGTTFGITRERTRQIIEEGISKITPRLAEYKNVISDFAKKINNFGGLKKEDSLLAFLGGEKYKNQVCFLLTLSQGFERFQENEDFYSFWFNKKEALDSAKKTIKTSLARFEADKKPLALNAVFAVNKQELEPNVNKAVFESYIEISKKIKRNPEGLLGLKGWVEITPRGIKDKAFLVLKKENKPLHFTQITQLIKNLPFPSIREAQTAVVHNELIRDPRFVLVGRGLYALKDWGYEPGVVKEVITRVLELSKESLPKEEIVKRVMEQRLVKKNTILLNLHNRKYFLRNDKGNYNIRES